MRLPMQQHFLGASLLAVATGNVNVPVKEVSPHVFMPAISIGTGGLESAAAFNITADWLSLGGRGIDTAWIYKDQDIVAKAVGESGVNRKDVFITTKVPGCMNTQSFIEQDLKLLGTDYIDLLLIHFPRPSSNCGATWAVLEEYHQKGVAKAIGISNFRCEHIEALMKTAKVVPAVNQMEHNILEHDDDTIACATKHGITVEAFSPLGRSGESGNITGNDVIKSVAANHKVSAYQVAIKWILQHGHILTFQSSKKAHQESDADVFGFNLTEAEMSRLDALGKQGLQVVV